MKIKFDDGGNQLSVSTDRAPAGINDFRFLGADDKQFQIFGRGLYSYPYRGLYNKETLQKKFDHD